VINKKLLVLPFFLYINNLIAEIEILTIDSFIINNMGEDSLIVTKRDDATGDNGFFFLMDRPFCVCDRVTFVQQTPDLTDFERPEEDTYFYGTMKVDHKKSKEVKFKVFIAVPGETTNVIQPMHFPSIREAKFIEIDTVYGKSRFIMEGFQEAMKQATKICESFIPYKRVKTKEMDT
tara:strand:+ start:619 stop:1149 length:531 start_codon:yes stop_codon:yes gene_type:complete